MPNRYAQLGAQRSAPMARYDIPSALGPPLKGTAAPQFPGLLQPGNIDLFAQPAVKNPNGGTSTVYSSSYNLDGREVLLPAVTPDGRLLQSDDDIVAEYQRTGRHLGMFATPEAATAYAEQLHNDYAAGKYTKPAKVTR